MQETQVQFLSGEDSLENEMATHSSILAWKNPMVRGAWQATVNGVTQSQTQLSDFTFFLSFFNYLLWLYMILHFCLFSFSTHCVCG